MPEPARAQTRTERRKARTVAGILDAAEHHFLEHGYDDARVDEIAAEADVAVGSIYNHFGNKEGLYRAFIERATELHELYMSEGVEADAPPLDQLLDQAGRLARFGREHPGYLRALAVPPRGEVVAKHLAAHERRTAALLEAAMRSGDVRPLDARAAAGWLWSAWLGALALADVGGEAHGKLLDAGVRIVVGGLAADHARESDEVVRALLEPAARPSEPALAVRGLTVRREPVANDLRAQLPGLALWTTTATLRDGPATPAFVRARIQQAREGVRTAEATGVPGESAPWAYRVAMRQLGTDPDDRLAIVEQAVLQRTQLLPELGMPGDALMAASLEAGVPVRAFDAAVLDGSLALRMAAEGDGEFAPGPVVADLRRAVAPLFGDPIADAAAGLESERLVLAAVQVRGVSDLAVQQALWLAAELIEGRA